ncbi:MAG: hypothetical protein DMC60_10945 [Verrucomicrobia bacterium]|nr:MAG: hypothetical protein DMC60_10945 [Verrucomicrobiota bacterium]
MPNVTAEGAILGGKAAASATAWLVAPFRMTTGEIVRFYGYVRRMKFFLTFSLACVAAALAETATDESAAVLRAERDGCVAYLRGDADRIAKFLTDD